MGLPDTERQRRAQRHAGVVFERPPPSVELPRVRSGVAKRRGRERARQRRTTGVICLLIVVGVLATVRLVASGLAIELGPLGGDAAPRRPSTPRHSRAVRATRRQRRAMARKRRPRWRHRGSPGPAGQR